MTKFMMLMAALLMIGCTEHVTGGEDEVVEACDHEDRVFVTNDDDEEIDDTVRVRCPDHHPVVITGGCRTNGPAIGTNLPIPEDEFGNSGWECRFSLPDGTPMEGLEMVATAVCGI